MRELKKIIKLLVILWGLMYYIGRTKDRRNLKFILIKGGTGMELKVSKGFSALTEEDAFSVNGGCCSSKGSRSWFEDEKEDEGRGCNKSSYCQPTYVMPYTPSTCTYGTASSLLSGCKSLFSRFFSF